MEAPPTLPIPPEEIIEHISMSEEAVVEVRSRKTTRLRPGILVLGSGGIKGLGIIGGIIALEREGYLKRIHTYVGTSIGAVISLMLIAGCTIYEILELGLHSTILCPWSEMHKVDTTILTTYGPIPHEKTVQPTVDIIMKKYGKIPTLKELYDMTGKRLVMVSGNLHDRKPEYFDYITHPDMPCVAGMTASMLLAGILSKFMYNGKLYIDGAFVDPYAAAYLDDGEEYIIGLNVVGIDSDPNSSYATYMLCAMSLSFDRIQELTIKHVSDRVMTIELRLPDISIMDKAKDINLRLKCFNAGIRQTMEGIARLRGKSYEEYYGASVMPPTHIDVPVHNIKHVSSNNTSSNRSNRFAMALGRIPVPRLGQH